MNDLIRLSLHHVGYAVPDIAPVSVQYVTRYGYRITSPVIHDASQTANVQFLQLPGDSTYLELVAPDGPTSKLANGVRRGGRLHHLCYAVDCLEDTLPWLEANGMLLISEPIPAVAFQGRRICWLMDEASMLVELVERRDVADPCQPTSIGDNNRSPSLVPIPEGSASALFSPQCDTRLKELDDQPHLD